MYNVLCINFQQMLLTIIWFYMEIQSGLLRIDLEYIIWTIRFIFSGRKSIYGPYGPYLLGRKSIYGPSVSLFLVESPYMERQAIHFGNKNTAYMDRQSVHFWKQILSYGLSVSPFLETNCYLWTVSQSPVHFWKKVHIYGPSVSPFLDESLYMDLTFHI